MKVAGIILTIIGVLNLIIGAVAANNGADDAADMKFAAAFMFIIPGLVLWVVGISRAERLKERQEAQRKTEEESNQK